ncbi:hypothetical protein AB6A40_000934 [Gnathostoma spinigerum]|uniref:EGF-like domain-containing protein n=1 Tax=Gnathostoma spinigerum TaxID=75299 RepID=A0ABD6E324_9BILA
MHVRLCLSVLLYATRIAQAGFIGKRSSDALWISQNPTVRHYFPSIEYRPHIYSAPVSNGIRPEESCTSSEECAGFPQAFCDGVCRCIIGAFNAGSACVKPVFHDSSSQRSCPTQQVYVSEAGMCMAVRKPDEGCEYSEQCSAVERGAYCFNRRCRCMLGMIASAAKCVYPSERCTSNGYVWIQETDECKPIIPPGMPGCGYNLQCSAAFDGAKCSKQMCQCPNELVPSGNTCIQRCQSGQVYSVAAGQCLPTVRAGGSCHYSIQCNAELPELICEERVCRCSNSERFTGSTCRSDCPRGYRADQYGICKPEISDRLEAAPTESCARGEICKGGSTCRQGICQCPHGSQPVNSECFPQSAGLPTAGPGAPCIPNVVQCTDGTSCIAGVCRCAMGAELRNGACSGSTTSLLASPGEPCQRGQHCDGGATCDEHTLTCVCPSDKIRIGKQCYDRLRSGPGLPCGNGELCVGGSICINNICQCRVDQIKDGRQCIMMPKVGPEESCARGEECIGGSKCDQFTKRCKCPLKHLIIRKECVAIEYVHPGEPCSRKNQRCIELSSCVLGRCRCDDDHTAFNGKCVRNGQTYPGEPCSEDVQCSGRASCMKGICTCPAEYVIINKECHRVEIVGPDEVCGGVRQCGGGSKCDESEAKCRCASGYQPHRGVCRLIVTAPECLSDVECSSGFICDRGQCRCPQGSQPTPSGTCVTLQRAQPSVVERNSCDENTRCHGELICIRNICTCPYPLVVAAGNRCLPRALARRKRNVFSHHTLSSAQQTLGQPCITNGCGPNERCISGICSCIDGFVVHQSTCVQRDQIGCTNCNGFGRNVFPSENMMIPPVPLLSFLIDSMSNSLLQPNLALPGQQCNPNSSDVQCSGNSICANGYCACPGGEDIINGVCISKNTQSPPGGSCELGATYCTGGSFCYQQKCTCPLNNQVVDGRCTPTLRMQLSPPESCSTDNGCSGDLFCFEGHCECPLGTVNLEGTSICQRRFERDANTEISRMKDGFPVEKYEDDLIGIPGRRCNFNGEFICKSGSLCVNGVCKCPMGFVTWNQQCVRYSGIASAGESCAREGTVCGGGSMCFEGRCICALGLTPIDGKCLPSNSLALPPILAPGSECSLRCSSCGQCGGGSICVNSFCTCPLGQIARNTHCVPVTPDNRPIDVVTKPPTKPTVRLVNPGETCNTARICNGGSSCVLGRCLCPPDYTPDNDGTSCMLKSVKALFQDVAHPGENCSAPTRPCGGGSECVDGICSCRKRRYISNRECRWRESPRELNPGSACSSIDKCLFESTCKFGYCICAPGTIFRPRRGCLRVVNMKTASKCEL